MPFKCDVAAGADAHQGADISAVRESVAQVLSSLCDRAAIHDHVDGRIDLGARLWKQSAQLGWTATGIPEVHGGLGLGWRGAAAVLIELGQYLAPGPFLSTTAAADVILQAGDEPMRQAWLPRIAGEGLAVATPSTTFGERRPRQRLLAFSGAAYALAWNKDGALALFESPDTARSIEIWDQTRRLIEIDTTDQTPVATFEDPEKAALVLEQAMALGIACDSVGGAGAIADQTLAYMKARTQFGRPIASFQALKHRMADIVALHETHGHLVSQAVESAEARTDAHLWALLAKSEASDAYVAIAADCLQLHGGIGFTWEYDCHLFLKRARMNEALLGANGAVRDLAATHLTSSIKEGLSTLELRAA